MDDYSSYQAFERGDYALHENIKKVTNYICGQLISWSFILPGRIELCN